VVLHDVAQRAAGPVVVARARSHPELLGHGYLDGADALAIPERLEDAVGEPEYEKVLDGLLPEVMIDAVDLALVEVAVQDVVQRAGAVHVVTEGLLHHEPREARA